MERQNGPRESRNRKEETSLCMNLKKKDKVFVGVLHRSRGDSKLPTTKLKRTDI
jgi:hypothetical protein